ncbi:MAG: TadE family type IV pilus minor pilin [Dermatophilaceae bacterium]
MTAELAAAMPVIALMAGFAIGVIAVGIDQIRCVDAARVGARALARGDPFGSVTNAVRSVAPAGASVALGGDGRTVSATVHLVRSLPGGWGSFEVAASSSADRESGS